MVQLMLTVQKLTTAQDTAPGLTTTTLIALTLGPKLKNSFPNKQSTRTNFFFAPSIIILSQHKLNIWCSLICKLTNQGVEASNVVALIFGEKVVKLCLMSSLQKGVFYICIRYHVSLVA